MWFIVVTTRRLIALSFQPRRAAALLRPGSVVNSPTRRAGLSPAFQPASLAQRFTWFYRAAHKAARAAGESPVKGETNALVVITDLCLERSDTGKLGRKRPIRSGASEMAGRSIKRTLQLRKGTTRRPVGGGMVAEPLVKRRRPSRGARIRGRPAEPSEYGRWHVIKLWQIKVGTCCVG
jgi:hypothetical protein